MEKDNIVRVGIEFTLRDQGWLGGVNCIVFLLGALERSPSTRIKPVLIVNPKAPRELLAAMPKVEILQTSFVDPTSPWHLARRLFRRAFGRDFLMEWWLRSKNIKVLTHCESLGRGSVVPTVGIIHDFGYKYFPQYYKDSVWRKKDRGTERICSEHALILLPSRTVLDDLNKFFPNVGAKGRFLYQIPPEPPGQTAEDLAAFRQKHALPERFFYTPNQFWMHKNHKVIVEALALLAARGEDIHVISTGATQDDREPNYFTDLMRQAEERGVKSRFHVLGLVPYSQTVTLMRDCMAVLHSSLFEGWGLSIAEARMMGKTVILTDIPVFREQAPEYALFFDPHRPEELADAMARVARAWSPEEDARRRASARGKREVAQEGYARGYEELVLEAARGREQHEVNLDEAQEGERLS